MLRKNRIVLLSVLMLYGLSSWCQTSKPTIAFEGYVEVIRVQPDGYGSNDTLLVYQGWPETGYFKPIIEEVEEFIVCYEDSRHTLTVIPSDSKSKENIFIPKGDYYLDLRYGVNLIEK